MNAEILCVGKLKENWQRDACAEYLKRLTRYGRYGVTEVNDLAEPDRAGDIQRQQIVEREGAELLRRLRPNDYPIALCIQAYAPDSEALAGRLASLSREGKRVVFLIGGSLGLSEEVIARSKEKLSLSNLTMPHALARVVLLEQLYRAEKIVSGERYHK